MRTMHGYKGSAASFGKVMAIFFRHVRHTAEDQELACGALLCVDCVDKLMAPMSICGLLRMWQLQ